MGQDANALRIVCAPRIIHASHGSRMSLGGSFMPLRAQLCPLGLFYAPWNSNARPFLCVHAPLCVRALGLF
jgi:hypothetical protein